MRALWSSRSRARSGHDRYVLIDISAAAAPAMNDKEILSVFCILPAESFLLLLLAVGLHSLLALYVHLFARMFTFAQCCLMSERDRGRTDGRTRKDRLNLSRLLAKQLASERHRLNWTGRRGNGNNK